MREKALALVVALVAVSTGTAQIVGPTERTVLKGEKNVSIEVTVTADGAEYLALGNVELVREYTRATNKLVIRVFTAEVGEGYLVVAAVKGGEMLPLYRCRVRVIDAGPQPVPPSPKPPEPVPPAPVDPLVRSIKDAAASDGMTRAQLLTVADAARMAAAVVVRGQSAKTAHDLLKRELSKSTPLGTAMYQVVNGMTGEKFTELLKNPTELLDESKAELVRAPFIKLAKAIEEAAK